MASTLWRTRGLKLFLGLFVCVFSLNGPLKFMSGKIPYDDIGTILRHVAFIPDRLYGALPIDQYFIFQLLIHWIILSMGVFLALTLLSAMRYQSSAMFGCGFVGLITGLFILTWITLIIFAVLGILFAILWIFSGIVSIFSWIFSGIHSILLSLFSIIAEWLLWQPILYGLVVISLLSIVVLSRKSGVSFSAHALKLIAIIVSIIASACATIWFFVVPLWIQYVNPIFHVILNWWRSYIVPIFEWIMQIIGIGIRMLMIVIVFIIAVVFILSIILLLGFQFYDQFASARSSGHNAHKMFDAGFGIGAATAVVLIVCAVNPVYRDIFNASWTLTMPFLSPIDIATNLHILIPNSAFSFLQKLLISSALPLFDTISIIAALFVANCSLLMGLLSGVVIESFQGLFTFRRLPPLFKAIFAVFIALSTIVINRLISEET